MFSLLERITKLTKKVFEDEFKKQEQNLAKIISGNLERTMQEIKSLKLKLTQNDLEERVNDVEENMFKVKEDLTEIYEYQIDPDTVNDSLTGIRNTLTEPEGSREEIIYE